MDTKAHDTEAPPATSEAATEQVSPSTPAAFMEENAGTQSQTQLEDRSYEEQVAAFLEQVDDTPAEVKPATPEEGETTPPVEETTPEPVKADEEEEEGKTGKQFRIKARTARDEAVFAVMKREQLDYKAAEAVLFGESVPAQAKETTPEAQVPEEDPMAPIVSRQAQIAAELQAANMAMDFEKAGTLQMEALNLVEQKLRVEIQQAQAAQNTELKQQQEWEKYEDMTAAAFPDAAVETSPFRQTMLQVLADLEQVNDPLLKKPESTLRIAEMAAARLGVSRNGTPRTVVPTPVAAQAPTPPPAKVRPVSGGSPNQGAAFQDQAAALRRIDSMSPEEFSAMARAI